MYISPTKDSELHFLNRLRSRDLELRFGPYVRSYFSPYANFFLATIGHEKLPTLPILTCRDGKLLVEEMMKFRPKIFFSEETQLIFNYQLLSMFPEDLQRRFLYYHIEPLPAPIQHERKYLLILNCSPKDIGPMKAKFLSQYEEIYFFQEDLLAADRNEVSFMKLQELYSAHELLSFHFTYASPVIDKTGDCFMKFMLMRKGAEELKSENEKYPESELGSAFKKIKTIPLSFRHRLNIYCPLSY